MYPRIDKRTGDIEIAKNSFVSRATVESDFEAKVRVRPGMQTADGVDLETFLATKDKYFEIDRGASIRDNLTGARKDLGRLFRGKRPKESLGSAIGNAADAVSHAIAWGFGD